MNLKSFLSITLAAVLFAALPSCSQSTKNDAKTTLPGNAREFLDRYFPDKEIADYEQTKTFMDVEITLDDGTEISFNSLGEWEELDFKSSEVPAELAKSLPNSIHEYIGNEYPGSTIRKIEKIAYGRRNFIYRIVLHKPKNVELRFTQDGENISDNPDLNKLPTLAQTFLDKHFPETSILAIMKDEDNGCNVTLEDKTYIYFDRRGNWTEIKGAKMQALPETFLTSLPKDMQRYIEKNYPNQIIRKIEKKSFGYRVRFNKPSNAELSFNESGMFLSKLSKDSDEDVPSAE